MPYKDKQQALAYYKKYNRRRTELVHQAKSEMGIPLDKRVLKKTEKAEPQENQ
jgi:hypothetical protein